MLQADQCTNRFELRDHILIDSDKRAPGHLSAAGSKGKECKEEELDFLPRSRRAEAGARRDEGREKPKGVLPPRFAGDRET
jgi:hypothetical protein